VPTDGCRLFDDLVLADTTDMYSCRMSEDLGGLRTDHAFGCVKVREG
jgi:hypothetical protein